MEILVVEDDRELRSLLAFVLQEEGYRVLEATSPQEAKDVFENFFPDLILSDYDLGRETSLAFLESLPRDRDIPIIGMSGNSSGEKSFKSVRLRFFLKKPFSLDKLLAAVKSCL